MEFIDKAVGVEDEIKTKIFIKGFKSRSKGKGMGLGLFLVKNLLDKYNGRI